MFGLPQARPQYHRVLPLGKTACSSVAFLREQFIRMPSRHRCVADSVNTHDIRRERR